MLEEEKQAEEEERRMRRRHRSRISTVAGGEGVGEAGAERRG